MCPCPAPSPTPSPSRESRWMLTPVFFRFLLERFYSRALCPFPVWQSQVYCKLSPVNLTSNPACLGMVLGIPAFIMVRADLPLHPHFLFSYPQVLCSFSFLTPQWPVIGSLISLWHTYTHTILAALMSSTPLTVNTSTYSWQRTN